MKNKPKKPHVHMRLFTFNEKCVLEKVNIHFHLFLEVDILVFND